MNYDDFSFSIRSHLAVDLSDFDALTAGEQSRDWLEPEGGWKGAPTPHPPAPNRTDDP